MYQTNQKPEKEPYTFEPHSFTRKVCHWQYCAHCGLVALKNDWTRWGMKMGCNYIDHPTYKQNRKALAG